MASGIYAGVELEQRDLSAVPLRKAFFECGRQLIDNKKDKSFNYNELQLFECCGGDLRNLI
ncbi:MAG: hypothetical protein GTO51_09680 [Candidatus Latescibacteria bacterium]|nr:hypothetical protein [Candidatus Latescibacterota bacterium]NIM22199.1 hypothetical protein [Candidatus Latescibacterota bacterium]NIM66238.1 hypothetical protein [Candidatus Latescibacterota bacterium]NIO02314.1 hypothetical protein [Candidatus Latescibacterota bacterium]NIO29845.1 hypothetical protein [Candidatus Latescibacterota bacterium]